MSGPAISWKTLDTGAWRSEIVEGGRYQLASPSTITGNPSLAMQAGQSCTVRIYIGGALYPATSLTVNGATPVAILNAIGQPLTGQEKFDLVIEVAMPYGQNLTTTDEPNGSPASPFASTAERTAWATANLSTLRSGVSTVWGPENVEYVFVGPLATGWEPTLSSTVWADYAPITNREKRDSYASYVGTYTGNGSAQTITLPFEPTYIVVRGGTVACRFWSTASFDGWAMRGDAFEGNRDLDIYGTKMSVGTALSVNGVTFHYFAVYDPFETTIANRNYRGNQRQTKYEMYSGLNLLAALFKRDNIIPLHFATKRGVSRIVTGGAGTGVIAINADGSIDISADDTVNHGEGNGVMGFVASSNTYVCEYTSKEATTILSTTLHEIDSFILLPHSNDTHSGVIWFSTDPTNVYAIDGGAAEAGVTGTMDRGRIGINTGKFGNTLNKTYTMIAFAKTRNNPQQAPSVARANIQSASCIFLGNTARIDCGVSNSLELGGAATFEWFGTCHTTALASSNGDADVNLKCLFSRSGGPYGDDNGNLSFGLWTLPSPYGPSYPTYWLAVDSFAMFNTSSNFYASPWQTGVRPDYRVMEHFVAKTDGNGKWKVYQNGILVKEFHANYERITPGVGHRMVIGATWNGSAFVGSGASGFCAFSALRIYGRELSETEIKINLRSCATDGKSPWIADGLIEGWLARDLSGSTVPALINPANNGTVNITVQSQIAIS